MLSRTRRQLAGQGRIGIGIAWYSDSPGIVDDLAHKTLTLPYNDSEKVRELFEKRGDEIACLIVEPIAGNMGVVPPQPGFLQTLRDVTQEHGALLIFDEVITGFRVGLGGAQEMFGIQPDLTTLGKIIGGGLPVGAYGGSAKLMSNISPVGPVYQAGTLSGNPLAMVAGSAMLDVLSEPGLYESLDSMAKTLCDGFQQHADRLGIPVQIQRVGSMFSMFFTDQEIVDFASVKTADADFFKKYFNALLEEGVAIAPSAFEAGFVNAAHTKEDIEKTLEAMGTALGRAMNK